MALGGRETWETFLGDLSIRLPPPDSSPGDSQKPPGFQTHDHLPFVDVKQWSIIWNPETEQKQWCRGSDIEDFWAHWDDAFVIAETLHGFNFQWVPVIEQNNMLFVSLEHLSHQRHVCIKDTPILNALCSSLEYLPSSCPFSTPHQNKPT